jgi:hypothetical protein
MKITNTNAPNVSASGGLMASTLERLKAESSGAPEFHGEHWHPCATFTDVHGYGVGCDVCAWNDEKHLLWAAAEELGKFEQRVIALTQIISALPRYTSFKLSSGWMQDPDGPMVELREVLAALDATKAPHDGDTRQKVSG